MVGTVLEESEHIPLAVGTKFTALMSHSGSRNAGSKACQYYDAMATKETSYEAEGIPKFYGWLRASSGAGQEYENVLEVLGKYATANHELIHHFFLKASKLKELVYLQNHHNFAERGTFNGEDVIIHRKGATPANKGQIGIIPGSSGTPAYIVEGLGYEGTFCTSSHGAGRMFSTSNAKKKYILMKREIEALYERKHILTHGLGTGEHPWSYKDIDQVIAHQAHIIRPIAKLEPRIVVMGADKEFKKMKKRRNSR